MRRNLVSPLGLFAAHAAASLVNIRFLFHGRTTPVQWLCFAVTLLYIGYWLLYSRKVPNAGITAYTVLFFVFMAGFAAARFDWNSSLLLAVVLLLMGPFAGLEAVFPAPRRCFRHQEHHLLSEMQVLCHTHMSAPLPFFHRRRVLPRQCSRGRC